MKIDLDWIQKELDAGREVELECVDESGFVAHDNYSSSSTNKQILCDADLRVVNIRLKTIYFNCGRSIIESMLKYFRIKHSTPTFDDLIDVAVQAVRDNYLSRYTYYNHEDGTEVIGLTVGDKLMAQYYSGSEEDGIKWINSLYTETFVIESEDDMSKIKKGALITMVNGESITAKYGDNMHSVSFVTDIIRLMPFVALKGATVTQKRG